MCDVIALDKDNNMGKIDNIKSKREAEKIIEKYALPTPFSIEDLARNVGLQLKLCTPQEMWDLVLKEEKKSIEELNIQDVLGFYQKANKSVVLNNKQSINRLRFTIAHEIGHHIIHKSSAFRKLFALQDFFSTDPKEKQANYFAGYLLIPDDAIIEKLPLVSIMLSGQEIIMSFSKMFGVSSEAMRIRLKTFKDENLSVWNKYNLSTLLF